jgi:DNA mismatch endonuclease, patch repair protein
VPRNKHPAAARFGIDRRAPAAKQGSGRPPCRPRECRVLVPSSAAAQAVMRGNKGRDSRPELRIRSILHKHGLRYRLGVWLLVGGRRVQPDLMFPTARVAVFVDGCFWHGCPIHGSRPRANSSYWWPKLDRNVERDRAATAALIEDGWQVFRFWEHEPPEVAATMIASAVRNCRHPERGPRPSGFRRGPAAT